MKRNLTVIIIILLGGLFCQASYGQDSASLQSWRRGTTIVLFSGVGGGILGLSTLSFYGKPQEHTGNITTGAALGVAGGLIYVLSQSVSSQQSEQDFSGFIPLSQGLMYQARWTY